MDNGDGTGYWNYNNSYNYLYDGWRVIEDGTANYTRGVDLSGTLEGAGGIGGLLARTDGSGSACYHADGNGNITCLLDASQTRVAYYRYNDPYGYSVTASGSLASVNVYRFSSKELHLNSGYYYYGYRFYDPGTQRWLNRDPIGERGGVNLYALDFNNPVNLADLLGLDIGPLPPIWPTPPPVSYPFPGQPGDNGGTGGAGGGGTGGTGAPGGQGGFPWPTPPKKKLPVSPTPIFLFPGPFPGSGGLCIGFTYPAQPFPVQAPPDQPPRNGGWPPQPPPTPGSPPVKWPPSILP